jgi:hypothetical protein
MAAYLIKFPTYSFTGAVEFALSSLLLDSFPPKVCDNIANISCVHMLERFKSIHFHQYIMKVHKYISFI